MTDGYSNTHAGSKSCLIFHSLVFKQNAIKQVIVTKYVAFAFYIIKGSLSIWKKKRFYFSSRKEKCVQGIGEETSRRQLERPRRRWEDNVKIDFK